MDKLSTRNVWKSYRAPLILLGSIILGAVIGLVFGEKATVIKPFGDVFLNLLFMIVVPLVFFSISSAIANVGEAKRVGRMVGVMLGVFLFTGIVAAIIAIVGVKVFPPAEGVVLDLVQGELSDDSVSIGDQIVQTLTVSEFSDLFSRSNMLALILFSSLLGIATSLLGEKGTSIGRFLQAGNDLMLKMVQLIMYYAPIGLGAYFASLVGEFGPTLLGSYFRATLFYYPISLLYFFVFFTLFVWMAAGTKGTKRFWQNMLPPTITSLGTCSSAASIPVNLEATKKMRVPKAVRELTVPLGAALHKDGSVIGGVLKIAFVFGIFGKEFTGIPTYLMVIGVALLVGMVMGAIPQGGMIAEMLILSLFGLPVEALPILAAISAIIDPPATVLNATGDNVASMMVARFVEEDVEEESFTDEPTKSIA